MNKFNHHNIEVLNTYLTGNNDTTNVQHIVCAMSSTRPDKIILIRGEKRRIIAELLKNPSCLLEINYW